MDLMTEGISAGLTRYLRILDRSSKKFAEANKKFKEKHFKTVKNQVTNQEQEVIIKQETIDNDLNAILREFFIPENESHRVYLFSYIFSGQLSNKYNIRICTIASEKNPVSLKIKEPSIIVQITEYMPAQELRDIWKIFKKENTKLAKLNYTPISIKDLKKDNQVARQWDSIDLLLEIYGMSKEMEVKDIKEKLPEVKERLKYKRTTFFTEKDIKERIKQMQDLLDKI